VLDDAKPRKKEKETRLSAMINRLTETVAAVALEVLTRILAVDLSKSSHLAAGDDRAVVEFMSKNPDETERE